jgi:hypothetical protein
LILPGAAMFTVSHPLGGKWVIVEWPQSRSRSLLPTNLPLFSRYLQLSIPLGVDFPLVTGEHVLWRDVANRAVQANIVITFDVALHQTPRIFQRQRRPGRMHSPLSDLCQRSIFPFDWG